LILIVNIEAAIGAKAPMIFFNVIGTTQTFQFTYFTSTPGTKLCSFWYRFCTVFTTIF